MEAKMVCGSSLARMRPSYRSALHNGFAPYDQGGLSRANQPDRCARGKHGPGARRAVGRFGGAEYIRADVEQHIEPAVAAQAKNAKVRVTQHAKLPDRPFSPNLKLMFSLGPLAGAMAGVLLALVLAQRDRSVSRSGTRIGPRRRRPKARGNPPGKTKARDAENCRPRAVSPIPHCGRPWR